MILECFLSLPCTNDSIRGFSVMRNLPPPVRICLIITGKKLTRKRISKRKSMLLRPKEDSKKHLKSLKLVYRQERMDEDLDLIPDESRSLVFKVTFDYYSPRSHFALSERHRSRSQRAVGQNYRKISPDTKSEIIRLANIMISEYNLQGVFSIHCGSWTTTKETFHAHICVDVEDYINLFHRKENEIPNWPSRKYVTNEWKASKSPFDYEKNVRGYPFNDYFKDECQGIRKFISKEKCREDEGKERHKRVCPPTDARGIYEGFLVVYHPSEPRVGFVLNTREQPSQDDQLRAMDVMYAFAEASKLTSLKRKGADEGCHICLVLDQQTRGFPLNSSQRLLGFIQVSGTKFYKDYCPDEVKESWFHDFTSRDEYKVYT